VPGVDGLNSAYKTPPLSSGQLLSVPIAIHNSSGAILPNWAGVLVEVHLADPSEVDIVAVKVGGVLQPHPFPTSGGPGSTAAIFTVFHPAVFASGTALPPSGGMPAITLDLRAKNTNRINNSDVDINFRFADIYHQPGYTSVQRSVHVASTPIHLNPVPGSTIVPRRTPGSTTWHWEDSHWVLVPSNVNSMADLHLDANGHLANSQIPFPNADPSQTQFESKFLIPRGVNPETGHLHHFPAGIVHRVATVIPFHLPAGRLGSTTIPAGGTWATTFTAFIPGSQIFAMPFFATASIGIEHVPEPVAPVLLLSAVVSLAFGFRARWHRRQLT
jgi:hypothetical protein